MSREYTSRVWQNKDLKGGKLLIMLALADHADAAGECWPGMPLLIEKTRLTDRQIRRVLNLLEKSGQIVIEERAIGRSKKPHYKLFPVDKAEIMSAIPEKADILSQESGNNVRLNDADEIKADISDNKSGHFLHGKADISDTDYSHGRSESPLEPTTEKRGEEKTHARDPLSVAWQQAYSGVEMPPKLAKSLQELVAECGMAAAIHGIKASATKKDGRNFMYIAECARNYVPPAPIFSYANGNGAYHVDIPGVHVLATVEQPSSPSPPPAPMPHDDPWSVCLAELRRELPGGFVPWLEGSRIEDAGMINRDDGEPVALYRVVIEASRAATGLNYFERQCAGSIRRTLGSVLRYPVLIEIVAEEMEPTP